MRTSKSTHRPLAQANGRMRLFEREVRDERWKQEHTRAMACLQFEATVRFGVEIYDLLVGLDDAVRGRMISGEIPYDSAWEMQIGDAIRWWLKPCEKAEAALRGFEREGFSVAHAAEFRKRHAEALWVLKSAKDAFSDPKFVALRDAAIDEVRTGGTSAE